jgi:hypothetical protein
VNVCAERETESDVTAESVKDLDWVKDRDTASEAVTVSLTVRVKLCADRETLSLAEAVSERDLDRVTLLVGESLAVTVSDTDTDKFSEVLGAGRSQIT